MDMKAETKTTEQMEADIASIAAGLAPKGGMPRPTLASIQSGLGSPVTAIGAAAVGKRLETMIKAATELQKRSELLATALAGPATSSQDRALSGSRPADHLFGKQMAALDELQAVLDSVGRSIERASRALV